MPTHLTRLVIRRILSDEPIVYRDCVYRRAVGGLQYGYRRVPRNGFAQRRSIFGFSRKPERTLREQDLAPGLEKMLELNRTIGLNARSPPTAELALAFNRLVIAKYNSKEALSDLEAAHALNTFKHILRNPRPDGSPWNPTDRISEGLSILTIAPSTRSLEHVELAEALFAEYETNRLGDDSVNNVTFMNEFFKYIKAMIVNGEGKRARNLLVLRLKEREEKTTESVFPSRPWTALIDGFIHDNDEKELLETLKLMEQHKVPTDVSMKSRIFRFYAALGNLELAKKWYNDAVAQLEPGEFVSCAAYRDLIRACLKQNERQWGQSLIRSMLEVLEKQYSSQNTALRQTTAKEMWDNVFLWAAGSGKGVDEVDRMMTVMVRRTFNDGTTLRPDVDTINQLVEYCISRNDPYFAERYITLGQKWGIRPNAATYGLQVTYRLSVDDLEGAVTAYKKLQAEDTAANEDIVAANKLIQTMCSSENQDTTAILSLVDDLNERKARFEPETVRVLSKMHILRNELRDAIDLLQTHAFHYSEEERLQIAETLTSIVCDRNQSNTRAWDTYIILQSIFVEIPREKRTSIMNEFFARGRADMAYHVFNHMRQLEHPICKANRDTYVAVLRGIADAGDEESLGLVHNQMKLDLDIDPDTRVRNALMMAYIGCGQPRRGLEFWEDIINSHEGPTYNSIEIALRACEKMPFGERQAKALWARLRKADVAISKKIFAGYVGALAGNHLADEAKETLVKGEKEFGFKPDVFLLGTLFNASYGVKKQEDAEAWIQAKYPNIWVELMRLGSKKTEEGPRLFNVDRSMEP